MDITQSKKKLFANKIINGETTAFAFLYICAALIFLVVKQIFKTLLSVGSPASSAIGAILCAVILFFTEKKFVFSKNISSKKSIQTVSYIFRCAVDFGFYKIVDLLFTDMLERPKAFAYLLSFLIFLFFNYYYDRLIVFDVRKKACENMNGKFYRAFFNNRFVLLSMLITLAAMFFIYLVFTLFPFGDMTVMRMDLYHQYGPLFSELYERVTEHKSFFYSWESGGGSSFLGNFFNYLSSPLTAIIFLFDKKDISYAITTLVLIKGVLSSATFTLYIKHSLKRHSYASASFGTLYAFCAYFLAYYWNVMWLDGMILLPLITLGIERIINRSDARIYVASLAVLLYSSYYMGYMACIFSVLYFFVYYFSNYSINEKVNLSLKAKKYSLKKFFNFKFINSGIKFTAFSFLSAALVACVLVPVYFVLQSCSATSDDFPTSFSSYFDLLTLLSSHLAALETTIRSSGNDVLPNIYCGMLSVILVPLYFANKDIRLREKGMYLLLLVFFVFSFDNNCANFIWHAFHFPNDLPYRFSFMYSFIVLVIAFKGLMHIKSIRYQDAVFVGMFWVLIILLYQKNMTEKMDEAVIYISLAFVMLWTGVLLIIKKKKFNCAVIGVIIVAMTFCEVIVSDSGSFLFTQYQKDYVENYDDYKEAVDKISESDDGFYRTELTYLVTRMDPCLYNYNGMSTFSSMAYEDYSQTQYSLGMFGNRINSYTYNTQTPLYNMMYSLKYLIKSDSSLTPSSDYYTQCLQTSAGTKIYKNKYFLPIAFLTKSDIQKWDTTEGNPFEVQQDFLSLATGTDNLFVPVNYISTSGDYIDTEEVSENGTYYFSKMDSESTYGTIDITVEATTDSNLYVYITSPDIENVNYYYNESDSTYQNINEPYIMDLGKHKKGDKITVSLECGSIESSDSYFEIYAYSIDKDVLDSAYELLDTGKLNITSYTDTEINGTVNAGYTGYLYTSVAYDSGWHVYIDGKEAKNQKVGNSQLAVKITQGEHSVKFKYTPRGLNYGLIITGGAWLIIAATIVIKKVHKKSNNIDIC